MASPRCPHVRWNLTEVQRRKVWVKFTYILTALFNVAGHLFGERGTVRVLGMGPWGSWLRHCSTNP